MDAGIADEEAYNSLEDSHKPPETLQVCIPKSKRDKLGAKTFNLDRSLAKRDENGYYFIEESTSNLKTKLGMICATITKK